MMGYPGPSKPPQDNCESECPSRTVGLTHMHASDCTHGHSSMYCCECFGSYIHLQGCRHDKAAAAKESDTGPEDIQTIDVDERLREVGIGPLVMDPASDPESPVAPECIVDHRSLSGWVPCGTCGQVVEPHMVTGNGPTGPTWGRGRGTLTWREERMMSFVLFRSGPG